MFYPTLMKQFHILINSMSEKQKEELKKNSEEYMPGIELHFSKFIEEEILNETLFEEIFEYQMEFNLNNTYFLTNPNDRVKALSEIYIHYIKNRVEPDKNLGICILEISLAGTQYISDITEIISSLKNSDKLELIWEKNNPFDKNAIKVLADGRKLGYIPRNKNENLIFLLKQEYKLFGVLKRVIWNSDFVKIKVLIYLEY